MFPQELFLSGTEQMGIRIDEQKMNQFIHYSGLLIEWNRMQNLTRIIEPEDIVINHYLDSFAPVKYVSFEDGERVCDVGTGAGFPGVPIKILFPEIHLDLMESQKKRVNFLKSVIGELELSYTAAVHGRAEELGQNDRYRERYDKVLARAVAPLRVLVELSLPLVAVGGIFIAYKGTKVYEEIEDAKRAAEVLGGVIEKIEKLRNPYQDKDLTLVIMRKIKETPEKYPRRPGIPGKKPL